MQLKRFFLCLVVYGFLEVPAAKAIDFPVSSSNLSYIIETGYLSLENGPEDFERRLSVNALTRYQLGQGFSIVSKLHFAPDFSRDTKDFSVYQNFIALGGLGEYSVTKWFRYFINFGPSILYQQIIYEFRGNKQELADFQDTWELNWGLDYALNENLYVRYGFGRRWRRSDHRLDKTQYLGLSWSL